MPEEGCHSAWYTTYSGERRVVPSITAANRYASSQNAARCTLTPVLRAGASSRQSMQDRPPTPGVAWPFCATVGSEDESWRARSTSVLSVTGTRCVVAYDR